MSSDFPGYDQRQLGSRSRLAFFLRAPRVAAHRRMGEVAGNLKGAVDRSVKDQPMATLAVAAAVGFVLGALWKS